jgi:hypothetical protein
VRVHSAAAVNPVIAEFDALDVTPVILLPVTHILSTDDGLEFASAHFGRGTPLLQQFLRDMGESIDISEKEAAAHQLPKLRCPVPLIPSVSTFGALVAPSMAATEEGARAVADSAQRAFVRIIFNETDFEYMPPVTPDDQFILVVRPAIRGHYNVWQVGQIAQVVSPFANQQTLTAQSLAFNLGLILETTAYLRTEEEVQNTVEKRIALIGGLCMAPANPTLAGSAYAEFIEASGA